MSHIQYYQERQEAKRLHNRISSFLGDFKVGTLLAGSGIRKLRGAKPLPSRVHRHLLLAVLWGKLFQGHRQQSGGGIPEGQRLRDLEESPV